MSNQIRWLWPGNHARILGHSQFDNLCYESHVTSDEDILLPGSDDELDHLQHQSKKRRIEYLANNYLSGKSLFLSSAALRGPFEKGPRRTKDKFANYVIGSPIQPGPTPVTFSPTAHTTKPDLRTTVDKNSKLISDDGHDATSSLFSTPIATPSREPRSFSADREDNPVDFVHKTYESQNTPIVLPEQQQAVHEIQEKEKTVDLLHSLHPVSSAHALHNVGITANSSSSPQHAANSPSWNHAVSVSDVPAPAAFTPINQPYLDSSSKSRESNNHHLDRIGQVRASQNIHEHATLNVGNTGSGLSISKTKGKLPKLSASKKRKRTKYLEIVEAGIDSPLLIRRKNANFSKATVPVTSDHVSTSPSKKVSANPQKRRVLCKSSVDLPASAPHRSSELSEKPASPVLVPVSHSSTSPKSPKYNIPPAIDISFNQDSLTMNFDFIDRHTNCMITGDEAKRRSVSQQLRRAMRESGACFTSSARDQEDTQREETPSKTVNLVHSDADPSRREDLPPNVCRDRITEYDCNEIGIGLELPRDLPCISTQAAMEEAHRALFDTSSPVKPAMEPTIAEQETPGLPATIPLPNISIIPFHKFNAKINTRNMVEARSPPPNTQALFDDMSPFLSPHVLKKVPARIQQRNKRASFAPSLSDTHNLKHKPANDEDDDDARLTDLTGIVDDCLDDARNTPKSICSSSHEILSKKVIPLSSNEKHQTSIPGESASLKGTTEQSWLELPTNLDGISEPAASKGRSNSSRSSIQRSLRKIRRSDQSSLHSTKKDQLKNTLSQVEKHSRPLSQAEHRPRPLSQPELKTSGTTTVADESTLEPQQTSSLGEPESSYMFRQSLSNETPFRVTDANSGWPTSTTSEKLMSAAASSYQPAQRMDALDLDSTASSITHTTFTSWDLDRVSN